MEPAIDTWLNQSKEGAALFAEGNYPAAIDAFNKSIALSEHWDTYRGLGWALFHTNNYPAAIDAFNKSIALNEHWDTYRGVGWLLLHTNYYQAAIDVLNRSIALHEHWDTYRGLGWAHLRTNNYPAAIDALNRSIALHEHWDTYQGLGWALSRTNNYPAAIDAFKKSIALHEHWDTYQGLGLALLHTKKYPEAIDAFKKTIAAKEDWDTYRGLGLALLYTKKYPEAIDAFKKSIALDENAITYNGLGWALFHTNNYPAAIDAFKKIIAAEENWDAYRGLGLALLGTKDYREALEAITNSYIINQSRETEKLFYDIYRQASNDINNNYLLTSFLKHSISRKNELSETYLKAYILESCKTSKIDSLFLRHASSITREKIQNANKPTDPELLNQLSEINIPRKRDSTGISGFHRYVFGPNHSRLHSKSPNTTVITCGAGTMFKIGDPNSRTKHFQAITSEIKNINPKNSLLIFEFGEVDIRNHIFKTAKIKTQSIYITADASISNYIKFLKSLKGNGYHIAVSGPHCGGGENPSATSAVERNDLCAYINDALNLECRANGFYFFTLFDKVVSQDTLKEIPELYLDNFHLCLPPSPIGNALNAILNQRIEDAISCIKSQFQFLQQEEVNSECNLAVSNIPNWKTGTAFYPGKEILNKDEQFGIGQYMLLIRLPFLMHPKQITLKFKQPALNIRTAVQGILEPWDISKETRADNVIHASSEHINGLSQDTSINHSFTSQNSQAEMCRFLIVRVSANSTGNCLTAIIIKRWSHQFQEKRLKSVS